MMEEQIISPIIKEKAMVIDRMLRQEIAKQSIGMSERLIRSIGYHVSGASYSLSFETYGRMVDMTVGRGYRIESIKGNGAAIAGAGRKKKRWYSKPVYNVVYGGLIRDLVSAHSKTIKKAARDGIKQGA